MKKAECQRLAAALGLSTTGNLPDLRPRIQQHLNMHTAVLTAIPLFAGLYYATKASGEARRTSDDKAGEAAVSASPDEVTAALRKLRASKVTRDPPAQKLPANMCLPMVTTEVHEPELPQEPSNHVEVGHAATQNNPCIIAPSVFGDSDGMSSPLAEDEHGDTLADVAASVESDTDNEAHDMSVMMKAATLTTSMSQSRVPHTPHKNAFVMVTLHDFDNLAAPPLEVPLAAEGIISQVEIGPTGQHISKVKLSKLFPVLMEGYTPVKAPGIRYYRLSACSHTDKQQYLGTTEKLNAGILDRMVLLNDYDAVEVEPGVFGVQLLWKKPDASVSHMTSSNHRIPLIEGRLRSTEPDNHIAGTTASDDEILEIPEVLVNENNKEFMDFLRKSLDIRLTAWPILRTAGEALLRYTAVQRAFEKLKTWGWERPAGGFRVPLNDSRDLSKAFGNYYFTRDTARLGVFTRHGAASADRKCFEVQIKALPDLAAWVQDPEGPYKATFAELSIDELREWRDKELKRKGKGGEKGKGRDLAYEVREKSRGKKQREISDSDSDSDKGEHLCKKRKGLGYNDWL